MAFILRVFDTPTSYADVPDVRTVSLLNYAQAAQGKTAFYTELDSGVVVGDRVFIIGGPFDNVSALHNPGLLTSLFTEQAWKGYAVESVNRILNEVVLNIDFVAGVQPCVINNAVVEVQLCKSAFLNGSFKAGQWQEGVFGQPSTQEQNITSYFGPCGGNSNAVPVWRQGIWRNGVLTKAEFQSRTDTYLPAKQTVKMAVQQNTVLSVSTTTNNNGVGYNKWLNGSWGFGISVASQATWHNGQFLGGKWNNGTWRTGQMLADDRPIIWANGRWNNGVASGVIWRNGVWDNGTWYGATAPVISHVTNAQNDIILVLPAKYRKFIQEGDLFSLSFKTLRSLNQPFSQQVYKARDFASSGLIVGSGPNDPLGLVITNPGIPVAQLNFVNAFVGFNRFEAGTWTNGQFYNGMFGFSGDADDYNIDNIKWEPTTFNNGLFAGGIWFSGIFNDGTMTANASGSRSRWINGRFVNGVFDNSDWEGGLWQDGYAGSNSSFTKPRFATTLWKTGYFEGGQFNAGSPQPDMMWDSVNWLSGRWHNFTRDRNVAIGDDYVLFNSNKQVSTIVSYATSGPPITANVTNGVMSLTVFRMKTDTFESLNIKTNDIIEIDIYRDQQGTQLLYQVYHLLTADDISAIAAANTFSENTLSYFRIPQLNTPDGPIGEVSARAAIYRPLQIPANYVRDLVTEFALRSTSQPNNFYTANSGRIPAGTYQVYISASPTNQGATLTSTNLLQALSITITTQSDRTRTAGEVFPGPGAAVAPGGTTSNWLPTGLSSSAFVVQGERIFIPQFSPADPNAETRRTLLTLRIDAGSSATIDGTIRVSPFGAYTTDKPTGSTFYADFMSGSGPGQSPPIFVPNNPEQF